MSIDLASLAGCVTAGAEDSGSDEEESSEEEDESVECVFHEGGSIGIVFDEGEEEDTVVREPHRFVWG